MFWQAWKGVPYTNFSFIYFTTTIHITSANQNPLLLAVFRGINILLILDEIGMPGENPQISSGGCYQC